MLTFFGPACFVCVAYYGRPPVVISHFEGAFKMPPLVRTPGCTEKAGASGEVSQSCTHRFDPAEASDAEDA